MTHIDKTSGIGVLYNGIRIRVAGDGPDTFTSSLDKELYFKSMLHVRTLEIRQERQMRADDRLWALPDTLDLTESGVNALLADLVSRIRVGGRVGLAARNEAVVIKVRETLVMMLKQITN